MQFWDEKWITLTVEVAHNVTAHVAEHTLRRSRGAPHTQDEFLRHLLISK